MLVTIMKTVSMTTITVFFDDNENDYRRPIKFYLRFVVHQNKLVEPVS